MSEAIGSKMLSLEQLFHTPSNFKFQNFAAGAFNSHTSYLWREIEKNLNNSSENEGFLYLKSSHMTSFEPNMDEGCKMFYRFNGNPSQDLFGLTNYIVSCKFFMIKNLNYLTLSRGKLVFHAMPLNFTISHALPSEKIPTQW